MLCVYNLIKLIYFFVVKYIDFMLIFILKEFTLAGGCTNKIQMRLFFFFLRSSKYYLNNEVENLAVNI